MGKITSLVPDLNSHQLIFGGDLNCTIDPILDRSNPKTLTLQKWLGHYHSSWIK